MNFSQVLKGPSEGRADVQVDRGGKATNATLLLPIVEDIPEAEEQEFRAQSLKAAIAAGLSEEHHFILK